MTMTLRNETKVVPLDSSTDTAEESALDEMLAQTIHAKHDFWIQTMPSSPDGSNDGVYLSTFQKGRGQHLTTLTTEQARALGWRLVAIAGETEA